MHKLLVDSHCHLNYIDLDPWQGNMKAVLTAARAMNVGYFLNVCIHPEKFPALLKTALEYPNVWISVGLHPNESIDEEVTVEQLVQWASHPKVIALGETGLDFHGKNYDCKIQENRFRNHIRAARIVKKPLIIHTRDAVNETLAILLEEQAKEVGGVLHCFTENLFMAQTAIEKLGFYISFSGILTFKNSDALKDIARQLPLESLLVETDAPYLAPTPFRGKSNQPAYVHYVAQTLAALHQISLQTVTVQTTQNFFQLFGHAKPTHLF